MVLKKKVLLLVPVVLICMLGLSGCTLLKAIFSSADGPGEIPPPPGPYLLKPADPIHIQFSGTTDLPPLDIVIDENGQIGLLHIKDRVNASGLTTSQLEDKIKGLYVEGDIYPNISVNVTMTAKVFYVQGEVNKKQGQFPLSQGITMRQAIYAAGGYSTFADAKRVTITREGEVYAINMEYIDENPSSDFEIAVGDTIFVPEVRY